MDRIEFETIKAKLQKEKSLQIRIVSDSMEPLLNTNEILTVVEPPESFEMFDLIVFYQRDRLNCHFLWRDQKEFNKTLITRSLKNPKKDDPPIPFDCVLGMIKNKRISLFQKMKLVLQDSIAGF